MYEHMSTKLYVRMYGPLFHSPQGTLFALLPMRRQAQDRGEGEEEYVSGGGSGCCYFFWWGVLGGAQGEKRGGDGGDFDEWAPAMILILIRKLVVQPLQAIPAQSVLQAPTENRQ